MAFFLIIISISLGMAGLLWNTPLSFFLHWEGKEIRLHVSLRTFFGLVPIGIDMAVQYFPCGCIWDGGSSLWANSIQEEDHGRVWGKRWLPSGPHGSPWTGCGCWAKWGNWGTHTDPCYTLGRCISGRIACSRYCFSPMRWRSRWRPYGTAGAFG